MYKEINKEDCLFLISEEQFIIFKNYTKELAHLFTMLSPLNENYQYKISLLDVWYVISTEPKKCINHPENTMIYPYRVCCLSMVKDFQMKRYIQLALYENKKLALICAIYIFKELDDFLMRELPLFDDFAEDFDRLLYYTKQSMRPFYDENQLTPSPHAKEIAHLQVKLIGKVQQFREQHQQSINQIITAAVEEARKMYEYNYGFINDWGGLLK